MPYKITGSTESHFRQINSHKRSNISIHCKQHT